jgi:uncharacterized protein (TIGR03435 family)
VSRRKRVSTVVCSFFAGGLLFAQSPKRFDVVSIRASSPAADTDTRRLPGGRLIATGLTVRGLIRRAWDVQDFQIVGGPAWIATDRYDVSARAPDGTASDEPLNAFIQEMLGDRFGLRIHQESRRLPRLALTVAKNGHKLRGAQPDSKTTWAMGRGSMTGQNVTTAMLAVNMLQRVLNQWVSDETGIPGHFDITLKWNAGDDLATSAPGEPLNPELGPSIYTAVQEQLGLKLVAGKGPVPVIVIDRISRPTGN